MRWIFAIPFWFCVAAVSLSAETIVPYHKAVQSDQPVQLWSFDESLKKDKDKSITSGALAPEYPNFPQQNNPALSLQNGARIQIADPGEHSIYDFDNGDEITIEAMVNPSKLMQQAVILAKGRTSNPGVRANNQNWAFRLRSVGGQAGVNFLFRSRAADGKGEDWHRWTSTSGFGVDTGWHHVAISYRFGDPASIRGYIDGKPVKGKWDMGGPTEAAPVVDNDEVWIGSALGGNQSNSLFGSVDEIALYRKIVPAQRFKLRYHRVEPPLVLPQATPGKLTLSLHAPMQQNSKFPNQPKPAAMTWTQDAMGFVRVPRKFNDWGVREDWGTAAMVRAVTEIELQPGTYEILARSRGVARLFVDGEQLLHWPKARRGGGAHNHVQPVPEVPIAGMRPPAMDDVEKIVEFTSDGGKHTFVFDTIIGGPRLRLEFGEGCVAIARKGEMFRLLGPQPGPELTDAGWEKFVADTGLYLDKLDRVHRREADQQKPFWERRHELARAQLVSDEVGGKSGIDGFVAQRIERVKAQSGDAGSFFNREVRPILEQHCYRCHGEKDKGGLNLENRENLLVGGDSGIPALVPGNPHESYLIEVIMPDAEDVKMPPKGEGLSETEIAVLEKWVTGGGKIDLPPVEVAEITPVVDDLTFLRRAWIDLVGVAPDLDTVHSFRKDRSENKRPAMIDRLLDDPRWADNWMGYWQDVLAENPNLLKPNLNNTGPFRYWILEALRDNKPMDRFATELILMKGSTWGGGAAGFGVASQNDVPMAAKAHIIGTAFLGMDMKCARCHDAPYHETTQQDLFEMASMLKRNSIKVSASSSVPASFFDHVEKGGRKSLIQVTLPIGSTVQPEWPFAEMAAEVPDEAMQNPGDTRERLAARVTFSRRFAEVLSNRVWTRLMGAGLVETVDDWEGKTPSDPELLAYLTDQFILSGYDLKQLARLIVNSTLYQREAIDLPENLVESERLFEGPYRRRMTAEQVVDTAWSVSGREMDVGLLTMDREGRLAPDWFMNFGRPGHAWEFTTLANERDRPSLAMPKIQAVVDVLLAFGWRNSRQEPTSHRVEEPNPIQPGVLANGVMGGWLTRLTGDSEVTRMCIEAESVDQLVDDLYLRYLTRLPTSEERQQFERLLSDGFEDRVVPQEQRRSIAPAKRYPYVSWSNHLDSEANSIKQQMEADARKGPTPTNALRENWREQAEDALWALLNSPEMILVP